MNLVRRQFLSLAGAAIAATVVPGITAAQTYPTRPVRIIVPYPPGAATDSLARLMGQWLQDRLRPPFLLLKPPGAPTPICTQAVVKALPDGHTLVLVTPASAVSATFYDKLHFNFIRDIAPVAAISREPFVMVVNPSFPAKTIAEFFTYAKANPGKINMASTGNGSTSHVVGELFKTMAGINMIHIPYRGGAPAFTDLLGGQVQVYFPTVPGAVEYVRTGKLRALAVTSATRSGVLPDIPPVGDFLPGYEATNWFGVGAPKNTPADVIDRLNKEVNAALADPMIKTWLADLGSTTLPGSPADFGKLIADETE